MKKLFFLLALMFVFTISKAQTTITTLYGEQGNTYLEYPTDVTLTNTTAKALYFYMKPDYYTATNFIVQLDSASGNHTNVSVALYGRISSEQATWTAIGSAINWTGVHASAGCDTTILFTNATETAYRQFKLLFTGTGTGTTTICYSALKLWYGTP
jgi:hypothetical protein